MPHSAPLCLFGVILSTGSSSDRKQQVAPLLTGEDILVSVFTLVFGFLAFFPGIQQFALLLLKNLKHNYYKLYIDTIIKL